MILIYKKRKSHNIVKYTIIYYTHNIIKYFGSTIKSQHIICFNTSKIILKDKKDEKYIQFIIFYHLS